MLTKVTNIFLGIFASVFAVIPSCILKKEVDTKAPLINYSVPADKVTKKVLDNGLTVLVFQQAIAPKVFVQMAYDVGSANEEEGERGLAHLIEHMIFKGTAKLSESDINLIARKYGASFNATTTQDLTTYHFETTKNNWHHFLPIMADCMQNARFDEQHLNSEMMTVIQELKMRKDNHTFLMAEKAFELLFPDNHPYHFPIIGLKKDLGDLNTDRLKKFYKKYYHPSRATLFIAGDVDVNEALRLAEAAFASIPAGAATPAEEPTKIMPDLSSRVTTLFEDVQKEQLACYWYFPGVKECSQPMVDLLQYFLGGSMGSFLYKRLVDQEQIATSVTSLDYQFAQEGAFLVVIDPKPGKADECSQIVRQEILKLIESGPTAQELKNAKIASAVQFVDRLEDLPRLVYHWAVWYCGIRNKNELEYFKHLDVLEAVTINDIKKFVAEHLDPLKMSQIHLLPLTDDTKVLWKKDKEEDAALDKKILAAHVRTAPVEEPMAADSFPDPESFSFNFPQPSRITILDNGLKIIFYERHDLPLIKMRCDFRDESVIKYFKDNFSLHLMMSMLTERAESLTRKDIISFFEERGVKYSFFYGASYLWTLNTFAEEVIERFAHIVQKPHFDQMAFDKNLAIWRDTILNYKDSPLRVAFRKLYSLMYKGTELDWAYDDALESLKKVTLNDLKELYKKHITPQNMVIAVAGDFDSKHLEGVFKKAFGGFSGSSYQKKEFPIPSSVEGKQVDVQMLRDQTVLLFGRPSTVTMHEKDYVPFQVLNKIVLDSFSAARIFSLRERTGLFYKADGCFGCSMHLERSLDYVLMLLNPENCDKAMVLLQEMLSELAKNGVTEKELAAARQLYSNELIGHVSDTDSIASTGAFLEVLGLPLDWYEKQLARVNALTLADLNSMVKKYASMDGMARVRVGRV